MAEKEEKKREEEAIILLRKAPGGTAFRLGQITCVTPKNWLEYSDGQKSAWLRHQRTRARRYLQRRAHIEFRAQHEKFEPPPLPVLAPLDYEPDPERPRHVIRAAYGAFGNRYSMILTLTYREKYLSPRVKGGVTGGEYGYGDGSWADTVPRLNDEYDGPAEPDPGKTDVIDLVNDGGFQGGRTPGDAMGGLSERGTNIGLWGPREFAWRLFDSVARVGGDAVLFFPQLNRKIEIDLERFRQWAQNIEDDPAGMVMDLERHLLPEGG